MIDTVKPLPNETCEDFCIRAHRELLPQVSEPATRNEIVWQAWDAANGYDQDRYRAVEHFSAQGFHGGPTVCHFAEHTAHNRDGAIEHNAGSLKEICQNLNLRIRDVDAYPALIDRHTVDRPDANTPDPRVLGYAGPFRIGMIGREEPRYAIFGQEWYKPNSLAEVAEKPRRSVELIRYRNGGRSYFDPIACLGADSPRLPMPPAMYSATGDRELEITRYSVGSPVLAGSSNTFVTGFGDKPKHKPTTASGTGEINSESSAVVDKYEPDTQSEPIEPTEDDSMIGEDDIRQIVDAILATPQMSWVTSKMASDGQDGMAQGPGDAPAPGGMGDQPATPAAPAADPMMDDGDADNAQPPMAKKDDYMMSHQYSAGGNAQVDRYAALQGTINSLVRKVADLQATNEVLGKERADAVRLSRLQALEQAYSGFVSADEEADRCLYSAGANISDDEFEKKIADIERYAARAIQSRMLPGGDARPVSSPSVDRYSDRARQISDETVRRCQTLASRGEAFDYDTVESQVARELAGR